MVPLGKGKVHEASASLLPIHLRFLLQQLSESKAKLAFATYYAGRQLALRKEVSTMAQKLYKIVRSFTVPADNEDEAVEKLDSSKNALVYLSYQDIKEKVEKTKGWGDAVKDQVIG
jgi:hypothetical protein